MVLGGYKRVAIAALFAQKQQKEKEQTRRVQRQEPDRSNPTPSTCHEHPESAERFTKQSSSFVELPGKRQETLKQSEKWNAEKQQLEKAEKKRKRNREKKERRKARRKQLGNSGGAGSTQNHSNHRTQQDKLALDPTKQEAQNLENIEHRELKQYGTELLEDVFIESSKENYHQQEGGDHETWSEKASKPSQPHLEVRLSEPNGEALRIPTSSPSMGGLTTPIQLAKTPDVLKITPRRRATAQIEFAISPNSSTPLKAAASLIITLKTRTAHLNTQITSFHAHLAKAESKRRSALGTELSSIATKVQALKKIIVTTEKHSNNLLVMEFALRDVIDQGGQDLSEALRKTGEELAGLMRVYEGRMRRYLGRLSQEAVDKSLEEEGQELL